MKKDLRVFFAGKIDPMSTFAPAYWRESLAWKLNGLTTKHRITDTSSVAYRNDFIVQQAMSPSAAFAQNCFYIQQSDVLVVNLTDDISVGGSQEIFIAKQFNIPVIGMAPRGGKFNRLVYELGGQKHWNWVHPFVAGLCDLVVNDTEELAVAIDAYQDIPNTGLTAISDAIQYYHKRAGGYDVALDSILSFQDSYDSSKQKLRIYFAGKMGKVEGYSVQKWRTELADTITCKSRFEAIDLDFLRASHPYVDESDGKLIFGRDSYLIRSSDAVVVNLSDDISIGGAIEMMIAKLYHRPLIAIAKQDGKFVRANKSLLGKQVSNYINPFVYATSDWLLLDPAELPTVIDKLFTGTVKTNQIISASATWYKQNSLRSDRNAQAMFAL